MRNKLFLSCDESKHTCDKAQYKEATLWQKIKLNIHLVFCAACRKYSKNNTKLSKLITKSTTKLSASEKSRLQSGFDKELANHN